MLCLVYRNLIMADNETRDINIKITLFQSNDLFIL